MQMSQQWIDFRDLELNPANVRSSEEDQVKIEELAASIREQGLLQPLVVYKHPITRKWRILIGNRRYKALQLLGWDRVMCTIRHNTTREDAIQIGIVENMQRKDLDPIEEAGAYAALHSMGMSYDEISRKCGRSNAHVSKRIALLELDDTMQQALRDKEISLSDAMEEGARLARERRPTASSGTKDRGWAGAHFTPSHPLRELGIKLCREERKHGKRNRLIAGVCGVCWEDVIRADERRKPKPRVVI